MKKPGRSGQVTLIAVLIFVFLVVSIPVLMSLTGTLSNSNVRLRQRQRSHLIADGALAYASTLLGNAATWTNAVNGIFPTGLHNDVDIDQGGTTRFRVSCTTGNLTSEALALSDYQVRADVTAYYLNHGAWAPLRSAEATFSPKTIGVTLPGPYHYGAALALLNPPVISAGSDMDVEWGPLLAYDTIDVSGLSIGGPSAGHPRLFGQASVLPYKADTTPPTTDGIHYWAFLDLGLPPALDFPSYAALATATPANGWSCCPGCSCSGSVINVPSGNTMVFNGNVGDTSTQYPSGVIYVIGDAQVVGAASAFMNVRALIVSGNLTIDGKTTGQSITLRVPPTASKEYSASVSYPCSSAPQTIDGSASCSSDLALPSGQGINIHGFVYAGANLNVVSPTAIAGSVYVGGIMTLQPSTTLRVLYDDELNKKILTSTFEITQDAVKSMVAK